MKFSLARFTEFICELQGQKTFCYQTLFKLLEKHFNITRIFLICSIAGEGKIKSQDTRQTVKYSCKNIEYSLIKAFFDHGCEDPFERISPTEYLLEKGMVSWRDIIVRTDKKWEDYEKLLEHINAKNEVCLYLQKDGEYIAALSIFPDGEELSLSDKEILKSIGRCITEAYVLDRKKMMTKRRFFHEFFDGVRIGAAILNQKLEVLDMNQTFSDFCKIIICHGPIEMDFAKNNLKNTEREKSYAQRVIDYLGENVIMRPERIKIDCLMYNYRMYSKPMVFSGVFGKIHTATCVYLTEYKKICNQWILATLDTLTPRELEILTLMAYGYDNHEIEGQLCISVNTIKTHQRNIYQKFNVANRSELIAKLYLVNYRHK